MKNNRSNQVSKARLIQHYVFVVETDHLPAPFNIIQWVLSSPMLVADLCFSTTLHNDTKRFFGRAVFWAMLGPMAVVAGWLLWTSSVLKAVTVVWRTSSQKPFGEKIIRVVLAVACCTIGAPFWLFVLWIKSGMTGIRKAVVLLQNRRGPVYCRGGRRSQRVRISGSSRRTDHTDDSTQGAEDESEDVVVSILKKAERG